MITMTNEQHQKIDLLDQLFGALSVEQLQAVVETEQVAARLRGDNTNPGLLRSLVQDNEFYSVEIMNTKADTIELKQDFESLLKILNNTVFSPVYNQDFYNLKQKHNIY